MHRACGPRRVNKAAVNVLLNLRYHALDVRVSLVRELPDVLCRRSYVNEVHGTQRSADIRAEQCDDFCLVSIGYGAHTRVFTGVRLSA